MEISQGFLLPPLQRARSASCSRVASPFTSMALVLGEGDLDSIGGGPCVLSVVRLLIGRKALGSSSLV